MCILHVLISLTDFILVWLKWSKQNECRRRGKRHRGLNRVITVLLNVLHLVFVICICFFVFFIFSVYCFGVCVCVCTCVSPGISQLAGWIVWVPWGFPCCSDHAFALTIGLECDLAPRLDPHPHYLPAAWSMDCYWHTQKHTHIHRTTANSLAQVS